MQQNNPNSQKGKYYKQSNDMSKPITNALSSREFEDKVKKLSNRLSRESICKEHKLISSMNLKLEIKIEEILKLEEFKNVLPEDSMKILQRISYLEPVEELVLINNETESSFMIANKNSSSESTITANKNQSDQKSKKSPSQKHHLYQEKEKYEQKKEHTLNIIHSLNNSPNIINGATNFNSQKLYKLKYSNSEKTIILAGINRTWIENGIKEFNNLSSEHPHQRSNSYKKNPTHHYQHSLCHISGVNDFWIAVEADTVQNAQNFKRFIRMRKKSYEENKDFSFKEDKRRVRIVMQNEDFYTLLVDAMTEKKLVNPNSGIFPSMCLRDTRRLSAFPNEDYQLGLKRINKILYFPIIANRPESKEGEDHFLLDEVYSEDKSRASEFFDASSNLDDLVQKADQGTQAESLGVGTNDELFGVEEIELNKFSSNEDEITSEMVSMNNRNKVHEEKSWESLSELEKEGDDTIKNEENQKELKNEKEYFLNEHKKTEKSENLIKDGNKSEIKASKETERIKNSVKKVMEESEPESDQEFIVCGLNICPDRIDEVKETSWTNFSEDTVNIANDHHIQENNLKREILPETKESINEIDNSINTKQIQLSLNDLREPQIPTKFQPLYFSTHFQTDRTPINYTKMKRLEQEYVKKSQSRIKLTPGIPEDFRQVSEKERNRDLFFVNIFKSMERRSQKKEYISEFF